MQLIEVSGKQGYVWLRQGAWLFRKNPIGFLLLLFIYLFSVNLLMVLLPPIGVVAILLANPAIFVGFMSACRDTVAGKRIGPASLVAGFRAYGKDALRGLLRLGALYSVLVLIVSGLLMTMVDVDTLTTILSDKPLTTDAIREFYLAMVMGSVLYIPVAVLFWFSPLLVAWHGIPVGKALFFSWIAVWRNRAAFILYGVLFSVLLIAVPLFIDALFASGGANNIAPLIATPYRILVMAVLYCSFYATYRGCFNVTQAAGQATDTAA
ncbi:BPSS1780 family membrane protein [Ralstonia pseudosolanacearum]